MSKLLRIPFEIVRAVVSGDVLREAPWESGITRVGDILNPERVVYDRIISLEEFKREAERRFDKGRALVRRVYIPAGDAVSITQKSSTLFDGSEFLWDFIANNVAKVGKDDGNAKGEYHARLREVNEGYWLHATVPLRHWSAYDTIDILGTRKG